MLILASYTTIAETICQLYFFPLYLKLGIYLPLICCNIAIVIRMETFSMRVSWPKAALDATKTAAAFLMALLLFATCRELIINGTLLEDWRLLLPTNNELSIANAALDDTKFFRFANTQAGAFILLGMLIALLNVASGFRVKKTSDAHEAVIPVKRARVTGRLSKE